MADPLDQPVPGGFAQHNVQDRLVGLSKADGRLSRCPKRDGKQKLVLDMGDLVFGKGVFGILDGIWYLLWCIYLSKADGGAGVQEGEQGLHQLRAPPELFLSLTKHCSAKTQILVSLNTCK